MAISKRWRMAVGLLAVGAFVLGGCADPADDVPPADEREAEERVEEAPEEPEEEEARVYYELTPRSRIGFVGSSPITGSQRGSFEEFEGTVSLVDGDLSTLRAEGVIDATSVTAGSETLVNALKADILDVEQYPEIRFTATDVEEDNGQYTLVGDLELHGVTREIGFPIESPSIDEDSVRMESYFSISRENWNIYYEGHGWDPPGWEGAMDDAIRPRVAIQLDLRADRVEE